ncbi:hypothetical protein A2V56_00230 [Candidatus Woesebacteria bacterium RBG_19FT_COMBO_42_9]|uniref:Glycosyltransferase RgtA/B/C/D-like domain-containing protein n=1 Tax=Candidatus Woesebacteria bacterium RBG_16_42_24 TaxID=1802485 RepID=A0A1F7XKQ8_9BACT|nr:MAG: hypothetical protein A2V97_00895 [Candidatus Woesebacteria bacterium RBG_16_42_24]OGM16659.1 MAG: hypothetical protein A2V56_00230 [Candidatus Woesebacteria bacterium RBG_19FT_COMBO_42_9]
MLNLSDFFGPLNISNLLIFFSFVACCEIIGYRPAKLFIGKIPYFLRGAIWLLGMGIVVFAYFLSHYFVPYSFPTILFVLIVLLVPTVKYYIGEKGLKSLSDFLRDNKLPLFIVLLVLPQVFVKSSQPPYVWDEMSYHYISPYTLYFEKVWDTGVSLYLNLPRLLDTAFISLFSLTKTYSVARLLQFSIFVTFLLTAYSFLKQRFGIAMAIAFFVMTFFYRENFLLWSTFGYVDIGTTSFVMIGFISFLDYFLDRNSDSLKFSFAFFGMAIGSKYSALTQFVSFLLIAAFLVLLRKEALILKSKKLLAGVALSLVLGGYWYVKNLIVTGNPIYPILFGCRLENCETISFGYTTPFIISNIQAIYSRIFLDDKFLQTMLIVSIVLSLTLGLKKVKNMVLFILLFVAIEIILIRNITGYDGRYFYHWATFSILILVAPLAALKEVKIFQLLWNKIKKKAYHEI